MSSEEKKQSRKEQVSALINAPLSLKRRLTAAAIASIGAGALTIFVFSMFLGGAPDLILIFAVVAAVAGAGLAAATTKTGVAIIYGLMAAIWLFLEIIGAVVAALFSSIG